MSLPRAKGSAAPHDGKVGARHRARTPQGPPAIGSAALERD
jgi:hypothetical protein